MPTDFSAFDRYESITDLRELIATSGAGLRKCVRVNTIKMSVDTFIQEAKKRDWILTPVPWCKEGFFVDREDRSKAIGKDILHLLGYIYIQEASSMLPVELLDIQERQYVLDISAAPGSKTTQIAAKLHGTGVVIANDIQDKRLGTLKSAMHRLAAHNVILMKRLGQWYGDNMIERFDRVLCDAPCTAQGTIRKDQTALQYSSQLGIEKAASLQKELLESAVHATKVGGRIVYSTCTLTPEENEQVVAALLSRFPTQLRVKDPREDGITDGRYDRAIDDSIVAQKHFVDSAEQSPQLRIWPQAYNSEGFFCAVIEKVESTKEMIRTKPEFFREKPLRRRDQRELEQGIVKRFGTSFVKENETLFELHDQLYLSTRAVEEFGIPSKNMCLGIPYGKKIKNGTVRINNDLVIARGDMATKNIVSVDADELQKILTGKDIPCADSLSGDTIVMHSGTPIGLGLAQNGLLKNRLSRWMVGHFT